MTSNQVLGSIPDFSVDLLLFPKLYLLFTCLHRKVDRMLPSEQILMSVSLTMEDANRFVPTTSLIMNAAAVKGSTVMEVTALVNTELHLLY